MFLQSVNFLDYNCLTSIFFPPNVSLFEGRNCFVRFILDPPLEIFPKGQFLIKGFNEPYRLDHNSKGSGIILLIRKDIPSEPLSIEKYSSEGFYVKVNLRKIKWLLCCSYNLNKNNIYAYLENLDRSMTLYSSSYQNQIIICDFNVGPENTYTKSSCHNFKPTCFKNLENSSCIDLILTNKPWSFQNSFAIETGLSDFHKMRLTVMKKSFQKYIHRTTELLIWTT